MLKNLIYHDQKMKDFDFSFEHDLLLLFNFHARFD